MPDATLAAPATRRLQDLPGPKGWPVLGKLPQIKPAEIHLLLGRWAQQSGRFFHICMAERRVLVAADHEAVASVLRDRPDGFRRTERLEAIGLELGFKSGLFGLNGKVWKGQRRMVMAAFDPEHVKAHYPSLVSAESAWPGAGPRRRKLTAPSTCKPT